MNNKNNINGMQGPQKRRGSTARSIHEVTRKSRTLQRDIIAKPQPRPQPLKKNAPVLKNRIREFAPRTTDLQPKSQRTARAQVVQKNLAVKKFATTQQAKTEAPTVQTPSTPQDHNDSDVITQAMASLNDRQPEQHKTTQTEAVKKTSFFRKKLLPIGAVGAVLLAIGTATYVNVPNIALRLAASRAGFNATTPSYKPEGYGFSGPVAYSAGQITLEYATDAGGSIQVNQKETTWDSQSLLDNHVLQNNSLYQTFQKNGLTIYVYDGTTATWVNRGIWYTITADEQLPAEELIKLATSL